jgi:hypothetical protein
MSFNSKKFLQEQFEPRTMDFPVPQLADWFDDGEKAIWKIQGLTGAQLGNADEAANNEGVTGKLFNSLLSANSKEVVEQVKELLGRTDDKPRTMAKRIYHLQYGSVDPECSLDLAVRLCDNFPVLFLELTNAILNLSGQGFVPGKSKPSGETKKLN